MDGPSTSEKNLKDTSFGSGMNHGNHGRNPLDTRLEAQFINGSPKPPHPIQSHDIRLVDSVRWYEWTKQGLWYEDGKAYIQQKGERILGLIVPLG